MEAMTTLSDCVFAWMRREFAPLLGVCEGELRPETPLARFLPSERRREFWHIGQKQLDLRFPTLMLPQPVEQTGFWFVIGSAGRTLITCFVLGANWLAWPAALVAALLSSQIFRFATARWATEHPDLETFGDLSRWLLARNMKRFREQFGLKPTYDEIFTTIRVMLIEMGAEPSRITPETSFAELCDD
jgi:hypothetical protein